LSVTNPTFADQKKDAAWRAKMQLLAATMGQLLPELVSEKGDKRIIEKSAKTLAELSHDLKEGRKAGKLTPPEDADPSLILLSEQFSSQTKRAYTAIREGSFEYGKEVLRSATSFCIACHTRHEKGPDFASFPLGPKYEKLTQRQKTELLIATRQFDKALVEIQKLIADPESAKNRTFTWEKPVRDALAIAVRVKRDPALALQIVDTALKCPDLPDFEQTRLRKWKTSLEEWKNEPAIKVNTEAGYAAEMRQHLAEGAKRQLYPIDRSAEIQYLRASAAAHDVLRTGKDPQVIAEALLVAGKSYEALANPTLWPMHEFYYEACIRKVPHTPMAQDCFDRLEQSVYFGYSGSSGVRVPADIQANLTALKRLSAPADEGKNETK
jgi:hypothetical protein